MSTLNASAVSLLDWAKVLAPDGSVAPIVEMLNQTNEVLPDMPYIEGNLPTGHQYSTRTGLPTVYWRLINKGVPNSKATTAQATDQAGMLHGRTQVDKDLAELNGNTSAFRLSQARPYMEAMNQEMAQTIWYGNSGLAPEEFTGLSPRYSSLSAVNAENIINGGGSGSDNSSIWLIGWGKETISGMFPKGSKAGLQHEDLGLADAFDADNNRYRAWMDHWQWKNGLIVQDWRFAVRICNIDISNLVAKSSMADLGELMMSAIDRIPFPKMVKLCFYMNRTVMGALRKQQRDDVISGGGLTYENVAGVPANNFAGIPIRLCDTLLETEATVA